MQAGQLRKRVVLQQRSTAQDGYGQQLTTWVALATLWAEIEPVSGTQIERARSIYNQVSHKVVVRWQTFLEDIKQIGSYRILYAGRIFDVGSSVNEQERNKTVTLLCSEGLNEGG